MNSQLLGAMATVEIPDRVYERLQERAAEDETIDELLVRLLDEAQNSSNGKDLEDWSPFEAEAEERSLEEIREKYRSASRE